MHKSQVNRAVVAARATSSTPNLTRFNRAMLRPTSASTATGPVRRSTAVRMTAIQRNSEGKRSEWNDSTEFFTCPKWSQTVTSQR